MKHEDQQVSVDRLFLARNCPDCGRIRAALDFSRLDDSFLGRDGQKVFLFSALTDDAGRDLLDRYGLTTSYFPILLLGDGTRIEHIDAILAYLRDNNMTGDYS